MDFEIQTALNGKPHIIFNGHKYREGYSRKCGDIIWRCLGKTCNSAVTTNMERTKVISTKPQHSGHHPVTLRSLTSPKARPSTPSTTLAAVSDIPSTPTSPTPLHTPSPTVTEPSPNETSASLEAQTPSLTELLSPYVTLTPDPPKFSKLDEENTYLRQRVAELVYTNNALTDKLIELEKQLMELNNITIDSITPTVELQTDDNNLNSSSKDETMSTNLILNCEQVKEKKLVSTSSQTETLAVSSLKGVSVMEADMDDVIGELKGDSSVAFAHTISGDFNHPRQMTAGVAVIFKEQFGKPRIEDCLTKALAYQRIDGGAAVYSLVTKPAYNGKPTEEYYSLAFDDFTQDFKKKGFSTLVCSPMGCVRDCIELDIFAAKINYFHQTTGATVIIVTKDQREGRSLRRGLSHTEFVKQLKAKIKQNCRDSANWYRLPDEDMKLYLDQINKPANTLVLEPVISHLLKSETREDATKLLQDLKIDSYDYVLAPVNDRTDDNKEGGRHWSLLLYTRGTDTYYHLDSLEPLNDKHAERLAAQLSGDPCTSVVGLKCCCQKLTVECGAYVLHFFDLV